MVNTERLENINTGMCTKGSPIWRRSRAISFLGEPFEPAKCGRKTWRGRAVASLLNDHFKHKFTLSL